MTDFESFQHVSCWVTISNECQSTKQAKVDKTCLISLPFKWFYRCYSSGWLQTWLVWQGRNKLLQRHIVPQDRRQTLMLTFLQYVPSVVFCFFMVKNIQFMLKNAGHSRDASGKEVSFESFELSSRWLVDAWNDKIVWWLRLWSGSNQRKMGSTLMTRFVLYRVSDFDLVLAVNPVQKVESTIFFPLQRLLRTNWTLISSEEESGLEYLFSLNRTVFTSRARVS